MESYVLEVRTFLSVMVGKIKRLLILTLLLDIYDMIHRQTHNCPENVTQYFLLNIFYGNSDMCDRI